ncbi:MULTISPECIES: YeiH family protein [Dickeya]|uniref:Membrane protein YeiH n=1 Tax=Dickeya aquatica TaxID=1401087 RepID=A0A375AAC5_9GAMM|nr:MULTISPECIES: YeiH family protein [Dickeya]SLM62927.1 Putative membrane protein YeiH [Dickeya aquatica]
MIALTARLRRFHLSARHLPMLPGVLLTGVLAGLTLLLAAHPAVVSLRLGSLTLAILLGMMLGNSLYAPLHRYCDAGVQWSKHHLLRWGIILYGFRLNIQQIASVGMAGVVIDLLMLSSTFLLACWLGRRWFKLDTQTVMLIGAGSSICGAAAVLATAPVLKSQADQIAVAIATVVLFGTLAMFLYPWMYPYLIEYSGQSVTPQAFGLYLGSSIHEVAQVVAAGHAISPETQSMAVIGKMLRVMMLAPFLFLLGGWVKRHQAPQSSEGKHTPATFPWFALGFVMMSGVNSLNWLPALWVERLMMLDNLLLTMAMIALGIATRVSMLRQAGIKPLLLAGLLFLWLVGGGALINLAVQCLLG